MHADPVIADHNTGKNANAPLNEEQTSSFFKPAFQPAANSFFPPPNNPIQQRTSGPVVQKAPGPVDIKAQEQDLKQQFTAIKSAVDAADQKDKTAKEKIKPIVSKFVKDFADYNPDFEDDGQLIEPVEFHFGLDRRAFVKVVSAGLLIAAASLLLGLPGSWHGGEAEVVAADVRNGATTGNGSRSCRAKTRSGARIARRS